MLVWQHVMYKWSNYNDEPFKHFHLFMPNCIEHNSCETICCTSCEIQLILPLRNVSGQSKDAMQILSCSLSSQSRLDNKKTIKFLRNELAMLQNLHCLAGYISD